MSAEVATPTIEKTTDEDYETTMPCGRCGNLIVHRYRCRCKNEYNYCVDQNHEWFWCCQCEEEQKIDIMEMPRRAGNELVMSREQRERADKMFGKLMDPATAAKEFDALKGIYDSWNDDPEVWRLEAKERIKRTNPNDRFAKEPKTLSEFSSLNSRNETVE